MEEEEGALTGNELIRYDLMSVFVYNIRMTLWR